jgi:hypothetical protein
MVLSQKTLLGHQSSKSSLPTLLTPVMTLEQSICRADELSAKLEQLLFEKTITTKTNRDGFCLLYWALVFEHHRGLLLLLHTKHYAPAFALMRPVVEAFIRLHIVMHGTEAQFAAAKNGSYNTEFATVSAQIDQFYTLNVFEKIVTANIKHLHGFAHGGKEQLVRRAKGADIVPNYTEEEVRSAVGFTAIFVCFTAIFVMQFLDLPEEHARAESLFQEYVTQNS